MTVIIPLAPGFEETEAITVTDLLLRAGIDTKTVSLGKREVTGAHGITVIADMAFNEIDFEISSIVLPGGMPGTKNLADSQEIIDLIGVLNSQNALVAAICAAPSVLSKAGILNGKRFTCYPGYEKQITEGIHEKTPVVRDSNIITSMGPGTAIPFALSIIAYLTDETRASEAGNKFIYSK